MNRFTLFSLRQAAERFDPETRTGKDQIRTESLVRKAYCEKLEKWGNASLQLFKLEHIGYLGKRLVDLPESLEHLDASQPWLAYWMVHALRILNYNIPELQKARIIELLHSCQKETGGFAGGPGQIPHLAPTYGAVNCLASLTLPEALDIIDRQTLGDWIASLHQPDGSFIMHHGGEADVRGVYCAVSVASLTGILSSRPEIFRNSAEWIASCQTYEGGFGGQPGSEAHGGYSFCAFAALHLLGRTSLVDISRLLRWAAHRQLPTEGGFQGRTHKLVDSCYSFWVGGLFPLIADILFTPTVPNLRLDNSLFDTSALQEYILLCCQKVFYTRPGLSVPIQPVESYISSAQTGGLIDKPGKNVDPYHTCYALSGLSVAQHMPRKSAAVTPMVNPVNLSHFSTSLPGDVLGNEWGNELSDLDPSYNIVLDAVAFTKAYFSALDFGKSRDTAIQDAIVAAESCCFVPTTCEDAVNEDSLLGTEEIKVTVESDLNSHPCNGQLPEICTSP